MIARAHRDILALADRISITGKVMGIILGLTLFFGIGFTTYLRVSTSLLLVRQLESRGLTLAEMLASRAIEPVLMGNDFALHGVLEEFRRLNPDVRYVLVISPRGELLGDTFGRRVPRGLLEANRLEEDGGAHIASLLTDEGPIQDIAFPLFGGQGGLVRVGMSQQALRAELDKQTTRLLVATLVVSLIGVWGAYRLSHVLSRPIRALVQATDRFAEGELNVQAPVYARDEIGHLAGAFNKMTHRIARQYEEIRRFSDRVLRENAELLALNGLTASLNRLYHINALPRYAAHQVATHLGFSEAILLLWNAQTERWEIPEAVGERLFAVAEQSVRDRAPAHQVEWAAVPLLSENRLLGVLAVRGDPDRLASRRCQTFLQTVAHHLTAALNNARLLSELTEKQRVLTVLFDRAVAAQEEERKRISRELHDEISQSLTSLMLELRAVERSTSPQALGRNVAALRERLLATLDGVHQMARRIRPLALDDLGLAAALTRHVQEVTAQTGVDVDLDVEGLGEARLSEEVETAVYRIVQEALANALRHAAASEISVVVGRDQRTVVAVVEDNGKGFDVREAARTGGRLGLFGMRERAALVGGTLTVESTPGSGTTVSLRIPIRE